MSRSHKNRIGQKEQSLNNFKTAHSAEHNLPNPEQELGSIVQQSKKELCEQNYEARNLAEHPSHMLENPCKSPYLAMVKRRGRNISKREPLTLTRKSMLKLVGKCTIGIDLAGLSKNPTGIALLKGNVAETSLVHTDKEILENIARNAPALTAIDAPLSLPKKGQFFRRADREMLKRGYRVFSPNLPTMKKLTLRAAKLNSLIEQNAYKTIEVHPTSTRKALQMPLKDWKAIQEALKTLGLKGELETRRLATHEIDAVTAALTATLYLKKQTESIGDEGEGYIIVPKKSDWRTLTT